MNSWFSRSQKILITWLLILVTGWLTIKTLSYVGGLISLILTASLIAFLLNYAVLALKPIIPRSLAAILVYLGAIFILGLLAITLLPPVANQARQLITKLPSLLEEGQQQLVTFQAWSDTRNLPVDVEFLTSQLLTRVEDQAKNIASTGFGLVVGTFNWFIDLVVLLVISFYMLLDGERLWRGLTSFFSPSIRSVLTKTLEKNLQRFFTGQLLLGLFMAISLTIVFSILKIPFFLLFAIFIGGMEIIPFIGATLGIGTVAIILTFIDWWLALQVLAIAIGIQQIKDNLVAPRIMGNLTGLPPVVIFIALLLGAKIGGLLGVILAIPLTGVIKGLAEIIGDPTLPPQTGSLFHNPFSQIVDQEVNQIPGNQD
ncbi:AI-2E family transporter [Crocosphaera sp. UHCC 0190]|uniref:AI-2E family transporter n=1 Tax=Crocosphaera sp. UHCC 0190 TaxID=3110246 RepID=UPI002B1F137D|nr:AI-2E family transporter [Crocosphaera sp. UHCC 0190]MEA5510784.1 AI-2E family transporter [Crocosphaera sp. UHCC 0190]